MDIWIFNPENERDKHFLLNFLLGTFFSSLFPTVLLRKSFAIKSLIRSKFPFFPQFCQSIHL